jgi:orotidine-5'-phosphate decarboxylase
MINAKERLIVALDVATIKEAKELVQRLDGVVSFFKIGLELQIVAGLELVEWLLQNKKRVFLDYKYYDVEETVKRAVARVSELGVNFLTVHGTGRTINAAAEGKGHSDLKVFSVTVLTCLDASDIKEMGFDCSVEDLVLHRTKKAVESGCDGVITSGREVKAIREIVKDKLLIAVPGVRPEGISTDEHKRKVTPGQAIEAGADYIIIGRPIKNAPDPRDAAEKIVLEMQSAFNKTFR